MRLDRYGRETGVQERVRDRAGDSGRVGPAADHDQRGRAGRGRRPDDDGRGQRDRRCRADDHDHDNRTAGRPEADQPRAEETARPQLPRAA